MNLTNFKINFFFIHRLLKIKKFNLHIFYLLWLQNLFWIIYLINFSLNDQYALKYFSYDQNVRLWDKRNFARPISTICLDGGVWRLKWDPFTHQYLLAACMHNGFKIINHDVLSSVVVNYKEHKGLSYGCDWSFLKQSDVSNLSISNGDTLMSTCSYEDCLLKVSVIDFWPDKRIDEKDY